MSVFVEGERLLKLVRICPQTSHVVRDAKQESKKARLMLKASAISMKTSVQSQTEPGAGSTKIYGEEVGAR